MLRRTTSLVLWLVIFEFFVVGAHGEADAGTAIVPETLTTAEATASIDVTASPDTTPSEDITDSIEFAGEAGQSVEATTNSRKVPKARPAPLASFPLPTGRLYAGETVDQQTRKNGGESGVR